MSRILETFGDAPEFYSQSHGAAVEWRVSDGLTPYLESLEFMETRIAQIANGEAPECIWLLEHPPLYTSGTSAKPQDLLNPAYPVFAAGRGGQYTYHGPGQRIAYVMLNLNRRSPDVRAFVFALEAWIISTIKQCGASAGRRADRIGVWVPRPDKPSSSDGASAEDKIAAIGIRVRRGVSFHGISINVAPDLSHFNAIVPCGIKEAHYGVTSLADLDIPHDMKKLDAALRLNFAAIFGP